MLQETLHCYVSTATYQLLKKEIYQSVKYNLKNPIITSSLPIIELLI